MKGCAVIRRGLVLATKKHSPMALLLLTVVVLLVIVTAAAICAITIKGVKFSKMSTAVALQGELPAVQVEHDSSTDGTYCSWF